MQLERGLDNSTDAAESHPFTGSSARRKARHRCSNSLNKKSRFKVVGWIQNHAVKLFVMIQVVSVALEKFGRYLNDSKTLRFVNC